MKKAALSIFTLLLTVTLLGAGCSKADDGKTSKDQSYTKEKSQQIAEEWIKNNSPTYTFDGSKLNLKDSKEVGGEDCQDCYLFTFQFESSHGGYGDRSDKMVTQVITSHEMKVRVDQGQVTKAITDGKFDEMKGEVLQKSGNSNTSSAHSKIKLTNISDGDTIDRVTTIEGKARGPWYFEANFTLKAKTPSGQTIDTFVAEAQQDWMTENFVPFTIDIDLSNYSGSTAILEFQKANPSGMPQHDDSYSIQVNLN
ncbi:MAG: hypothetical protein ABEJ02_04150 [Candidatus Paceibacteria bacterium]